MAVLTTTFGIGLGSSIDLGGLACKVLPLNVLAFYHHLPGGWAENISFFGGGKGVLAIVAKALEGGSIPTSPAPSLTPLGKLWSQTAVLEAQDQALKDRVTDLEQKLFYAVIIDQGRQEDFILTALVTPPSHEGISDWVATAHGEKYWPSLGKISQLNRHYGTVAGLILLDEKVTSRFKDALADEIFFCGTPSSFPPHNK